jgi:hypothetical protein
MICPNCDKLYQEYGLDVPIGELVEHTLFIFGISSTVYVCPECQHKYHWNPLKTVLHIIENLGAKVSKGQMDGDEFMDKAEDAIKTYGEQCITQYKEQRELESKIAYAPRLGEKYMIQLYVWTGVFTDYTDGIAFALAESVIEAQDLILRNVWGPTEVITEKDRDNLPIANLTIYPLNKKIGFGIYGGS